MTAASHPLALRVCLDPSWCGREVIAEHLQVPSRGADTQQWEQGTYHGRVCLRTPALRAAPRRWQEASEHLAASGHEEMEMMEVNSLGR